MIGAIVSPTKEWARVYTPNPRPTRDRSRSKVPPEKRKAKPRAQRKAAKKK